jgi:hypothetical protein
MKFSERASASKKRSFRVWRTARFAYIINSTRFESVFEVVARFSGEQRRAIKASTLVCLHEPVVVC